MEMPSAEFFYAVATIAMTFSGFSAIVVTLRQGTGGPLSPLHILLTRLFIECGLMAALFAIIPPLLAISGIGEARVWQVASATIIAVSTPYCYAYPKRRRRAAPEQRVPPRFYMLTGLSALAIASLVANVIGWPYVPNPFPVAFFVVDLLFAAGVVFLATYSLFLTSERRRLNDPSER
jgi:hypothetical protein